MGEPGNSARSSNTRLSRQREESSNAAACTSGAASHWASGLIAVSPSR
jgi:hypothetical protein